MFTVVGFFFIVLGLSTLALSLFKIWRAGKTKKWPTVQGKILSSRLRASSSEYGLSYGAQVNYTYVVNGKKYHSDRVFFGDQAIFSFSIMGIPVGRSSEKAARRRLQLYPPESNVTVHYDPEKPKEPVLEPGVNNKLYSDCANALIVTLIGIGALLISKAV